MDGRPEALVYSCIKKWDRQGRDSMLAPTHDGQLGAGLRGPGAVVVHAASVHALVRRLDVGEFEEGEIRHVRGWGRGREGEGEPVDVCAALAFPPVHGIVRVAPIVAGGGKGGAKMSGWW